MKLPRIYFTFTNFLISMAASFRWNPIWQTVDRVLSIVRFLNSARSDKLRESHWFCIGTSRGHAINVFKRAKPFPSSRWERTEGTVHRILSRLIFLNSARSDELRESHWSGIEKSHGHAINVFKRAKYVYMQMYIYIIARVISLL